MIPAIQRIDEIAYDSGRFLEDLRAAAECIEAPFDAQVVAKTLDVYEAEFQRCVVQLKATCRAGSGVYYRFFYKWERDLNELALRHGLVPAEKASSIDLQHQVLNRFPGATRAGLDFDTGFGLAKVWTFTGGPVSLAEVLDLPAVPKSVHRHADFFARHGLRHVFFVASDVQQDSMNVYFGLEEDCRNEAWIRKLAEETSGAPEDPRVYAQMVSSLAVSAGVGTTFRWDDDGMLRWCLYGLNMPYGDKAMETNCPPLPTRLARFQKFAPSLNAEPQINVAWSFGRAGYYTKLEKSYAKDADFFLTHEMGGNLAHPDFS